MLLHVAQLRQGQPHLAHIPLLRRLAQILPQGGKEHLLPLPHGPGQLVQHPVAEGQLQRLAGAEEVPLALHQFFHIHSSLSSPLLFSYGPV